MLLFNLYFVAGRILIELILWTCLAGRMAAMWRDTLCGLFLTTGNGLQGILQGLAYTLWITKITSRGTQRTLLTGSRTCSDLPDPLLLRPLKDMNFGWKNNMDYLMMMMHMCWWIYLKHLILLEGTFLTVDVHYVVCEMNCYE